MDLRQTNQEMQKKKKKWNIWFTLSVTVSNSI